MSGPGFSQASATAGMSGTGSSPAHGQSRVFKHLPSCRVTSGEGVSGFSPAPGPSREVRRRQIGAVPADTRSTFSPAPGPSREVRCREISAVPADARSTFSPAPGPSREVRCREIGAAPADAHSTFSPAPGPSREVRCLEIGAAPADARSTFSPAPGQSVELDAESRALLIIDQLKKASVLRLLSALQRLNESTQVSTLDANDTTRAVAGQSTSRFALASENEVEEVEGSEEIVEVPDDLPPRAALYRKPITAGDIYIVKKLNTRHWTLAKVLAIICNVRIGIKNNRFIVGFSDQRTQKRPVEANEMAYHDACDTMIPKGSGVVSNIDSNKLHYYPGIVVETPGYKNNHRYLVFFDKGDLRYCHHNELHVICDVYRPRMSSKIDSFWLKDVILHKDQYLMKFRLGQTVSVLQEDSWVEGTVQEIDCSILKLKFPDGNSGWYSRGSYHFQRFIEGDLPPHLKRSNHKQRHLLQIQKSFRVVCENEHLLLNDGTSSTLALTHPGTTPKPAVMNTDALVSVSPQLEVPATHNLPTTMPLPASLEYRLRYSASSRTTRLIPLLKIVPKNLGLHICNPHCVASPDVIGEIDPTYSPLARPFSIGFQRSTTSGEVRYVTPCGRSIRNVRDLTCYFDQTNIALSVNEFDFSPSIDPLCVFRLEADCIFAQKHDVSDGVEDHPIPCVNEYSNTLPESIKYVTKRKLMAARNDVIYEDFVSCCSCTDDCRDSTKCECASLTMNSYKEIIPHEEKPLAPEDVLYKHKKLLQPVNSGIFECNTKCPCSNKCGNRVAQFPISVKLQLFQTSTKGWGVRPLHDIPKGTFIATYVGILLNEVEANEWGVLHGDAYLTDLDYIKIQELRKPGYEEEAPLLSPEEDEGDESDSSSTVDEEQQRRMAEFAAKLRKRVGKRPTWIPKKKKKRPEKPRYPKNSLRYLFPRDQAEYVIDAKITGNVGRYFNHSCDPNMTVQNVFIRTHDLRFPEIAFFTNRHVYAGTELTWNYSYVVGSVTGGKRLYCLCKSSNCSKRLY